MNETQPRAHQDSGIHHTITRIRKFKNCATCIEAGNDVCLHGTPIEEVEIIGNILLNAGINELWTLACGSGGTEYDNGHAYIGVGDSSTAASATQTGLQASSNKTYKPMDATFPTSGSSQLVTFQATFGGSDANYSWQEFSVRNHSDETSGQALNRLVSNQGTKTSGQTWQVQIQITLS